jgi:hypothetical protein
VVVEPAAPEPAKIPAPEPGTAEVLDTFRDEEVIKPVAPPDQDEMELNDVYLSLKEEITVATDPITVQAAEGRLQDYQERLDPDLYGELMTMIASKKHTMRQSSRTRK